MLKWTVLSVLTWKPTTSVHFSVSQLLVCHGGFWVSDCIYPLMDPFFNYSKYQIKYLRQIELPPYSALCFTCWTLNRFLLLRFQADVEKVATAGGASNMWCIWLTSEAIFTLMKRLFHISPDPKPNKAVFLLCLKLCGSAVEMGEETGLLMGPGSFIDY